MLFRSQVPDPHEPATSAPTGVGRSLLVDPMGAVRLDLGSAAVIASGDVDTETTARVRSVLPSLQHRRPDIVRPAPDPVPAQA